MHTVDELIGRLRSEGRKLTPQRQCILDVLADTQGSHPGAETIHAAVVERLPMVSLKTVYQALNDLVAMGELRHLDLGVGAARFDCNTGPHHHLVCDGCGRIWDVAAVVPDPLPTGAGDFAVASTDIVFRGRCRDCGDHAAVAPAGPAGDPSPPGA